MRPAFSPVKPCDPELPKAAVRRLVDQAGGVKRAAVTLGLSVTQTYAVTDPGVADELSFARVASLTTPESPAAVEYLALLAGGAFLPMAPADGSLGELTAAAIVQHGEACAELVRALKDGALQDSERPAAIRELDDALRALVQLRCAVARPRETDS